MLGSIFFSLSTRSASSLCHARLQTVCHSLSMKKHSELAKSYRAGSFGSLEEGKYVVDIDKDIKIEDWTCSATLVWHSQ